MKYYKLITKSDTEYQTFLEEVPENLLYKNLYEKYGSDQINCIKLYNETTPTDVLNNGTLSITGLIVSNRLYEIIKKFNLHEVQFTDIVHLNYKFMFFNGDLTNFINYEKSKFKLFKKVLSNISDIDIKIPENRDEVIKSYREHCVTSIFKVIKPTNGYIFKENFDLKNYDVFRIGHYDKSFYVSENVKKEFEKNQISGAEFVLQDLFNTDFQS